METTVYRRKGIRNAIQEFDAFVKVVDDIKEKPKICSGICKFKALIPWFSSSFSIDSFIHSDHNSNRASTLLSSYASRNKISILSGRRVRRVSNFLYYGSKHLIIHSALRLPVLDIDLIVASACNNLAIMPVGVDANKFITKSPSRFEMSSDELALWKKLQVNDLMNQIFW